MLLAQDPTQTTVTAARHKPSSTVHKAHAHAQLDSPWMPMVTASAAVTLVLLVPEVLLTSAQDVNPTPSSVTDLVSVTVAFTWMEMEIVRAATTLAQPAHLVSTLDAQLANPMQHSTTANASATVDSLKTATATVCPSTATKHVTDAQDLTPTTVWDAIPMLL